METGSKTIGQRRCLCGIQSSAKTLFFTDNKAVCRCDSCSQVYVVGIDENEVHAVLMLPTLTVALTS